MTMVQEAGLQELHKKVAMLELEQVVQLGYLLWVVLLEIQMR